MLTGTEEKGGMAGVYGDADLQVAVEVWSPHSDVIRAAVCLQC